MYNIIDEDLIKWGWPEDVWFHVDKYSSAHVYLRLRLVSTFYYRRACRCYFLSITFRHNYVCCFVYTTLQGQTIDDIPSTVLEDAAQLVKANSIEGNKMNDVDVVYTMWSNLKKTQGMDVGQIGFHKDKDVRKIHVAKRINTIVNRLTRTKRSEQVNFMAEREERDRNEREDKKKVLREQKEKEKADEKQRKEDAEMRQVGTNRVSILLIIFLFASIQLSLFSYLCRSYNSLFNETNMTSNAGTTGYDSDDFM